MRGNTIVTGGVTLRATLNNGGTDLLPGDTTTSGTGTLTATVRAPLWMTPEVLRVYRNGVLLLEEAIVRPSDGVDWHSLSLPIDDAEDAWYAVEVDSSRAMGNVWRGGRPYALTNAFFVDAGSP